MLALILSIIVYFEQIKEYWRTYPDIPSENIPPQIHPDIFYIWANWEDYPKGEEDRACNDENNPSYWDEVIDNETEVGRDLTCRKGRRAE